MPPPMTTALARSTEPVTLEARSTASTTDSPPRERHTSPRALPPPPDQPSPAGQPIPAYPGRQPSLLRRRRLVGLWTWPLVRQRGLLGFRQQEQEKDSGDRRQPANLDRVTEPNPGRDKADELQPHDSSGRRGHGQHRFGRRSGAGRKQVCGPR